MAAARRGASPPATVTALLVVLLLTASTLVSTQPLEVVTLQPKTFEHETQAATGQTTGQWFVLFTNSSAKDSSLQVSAEDAWEHLAEDEDKSTIMAKVDLSESGGEALAKRFELLDTTPTTPAAILFRDRSMYRLDLAAAAAAADADKIAAAVHAFMDGGYEHEVPHPVPREASLVDIALDALHALRVSPTPMMWAGIACLALGALIFLGFLIFGIYYMYAPDRPAPQPKKQPAAATAAKKSDAAAVGGGSGEGDDDDDDAVVQGSDRKGPSTRATRRRA